MSDKRFPISTPELFYGQVGGVGIERARAFSALGDMLGIEADIPGNHELSEALIEQSHTEIKVADRDELLVGQQIVRLLRQYPWLQPESRIHQVADGVTSMNMKMWAGNHLFDNFPGLFGITPIEAGIFRVKFDYPDQDQDFEATCFNLGITFTT